MNVALKPCVTDDEFSKVCLFFLERRHDLHPDYTTLDMVSVLYTSITQGHLHLVVMPDKRIIAASAYTLGTSERDYADKGVAFIENVILDKAFRGTRRFVQGLKLLVGWIASRHPEVEEIRFMAFADNSYLCKLYAKFASVLEQREGPAGRETIFCEKVTQLTEMLRKYDI